MLEFFTGIISGIISGTGMGGGTILILILSVFLGTDQHIAQGINLVFFIPTSITGIVMNSKEKLIDWKIAVPIALFGIIGALIGAKLSINLDIQVLRKYFGIFLILITMYEIKNRRIRMADVRYQLAWNLL